MRFGDILRLCRQNLWRRKSRTILTVLGVIVGCCSIVLMISLGQGINEQNEKMLKQMGDLSIITVYNYGSYTSGNAGGEPITIDDKVIESMRAIPDVAGATPVMNYGYTATVKAGPGNRYISEWVQIMGVDMNQLDAVGYKLADGVVPGKTTGTGNTNEMQTLVGEYFSYSFMDTLKGNAMRTNPEQYGGYYCEMDASGQCVTPEAEDPFVNPMTTRMTLITGLNYSGDPSSMGGYGGMGGSGSTGGGDSETLTFDLSTTGVITADDSKGWATNSGLVMDLSALKAIMAKIDPASAKKAVTYDTVYVKASSLSAVPDVESALKAMGYETSSYEDMRKSLEEQSRAIQLILGGIGAVSLLVAAIGIANTMVMSVTERTREIGIMKALGCYVRDIRVMFLTEAGAIGFFGGLIGCMLSGLISFGINVAGMMFAGGLSTYPDAAGSSSGGESSFGTIAWQALVGGEDVTRYSVIPWWLFVFAVLFSTLIGLLFGFGPANRAVKIPALDAIKNSE